MQKITLILDARHSRLLGVVPPEHAKEVVDIFKLNEGVDAECQDIDLGDFDVDGIICRGEFYSFEE